MSGSESGGEGQEASRNGTLTIKTIPYKIKIKISSALRGSAARQGTQATGARNKPCRHVMQRTGSRKHVTRARWLLSSALLIIVGVFVLGGSTHRERIQIDDPKAKTVVAAKYVVAEASTDKMPNNATIDNVRPDRPIEVPQGARGDKVSDAEIKPDGPVERGVSIYLFNTFNESNQISSIEWDHAASIWGRNTTYNHLLQGASSLHDIQRATFGSMLNNITVLFHTFPKTGSSTLRHACLETQYDSCNLPRRNDGIKWPEGYRKSGRLIELFALCPDTRHFCLKMNYLTKDYALAHETRTFLHLFPFRNYDEWVVSALHQIYYREGEKGCRKEMKLLEDCQPHKYEMDYQKYTKAGLARYIKSLGKMAKDNDEYEWRNHHHALLYNYVHLDGLMSWLNDNYDVPLLPGTRELSSYCDQCLNSY